MPTYLINTETQQIVENTPNLGKYFRSAPWCTATQPEIDKQLLKEAKTDKLDTLKITFENTIQKGYDYKGDTFKINPESLNSMQRKDKCSSKIPDRYTWSDIKGELINFKSTRAFRAFITTSFDKYEILIGKFKQFKNKIRKAENSEVLNDIKTDFSEDK